MTSFYKKKFRFVAVLIIGLVLPAFLLPFTHVHSEYSHHHTNKIAAHEHQAHFHSEVLEAFAHVIAHPSAPEQDNKFHQTHSSPNHDKDDVEFYIIQKNVSPINSIYFVKHVDTPLFFEASNPLLSYRVGFEIPTFKSPEFLGTHFSRGPPSIFI